MENLWTAGLQCGEIFSPTCLHRPYRGWVGGELHVASLVTEQFPSLPVSLPQQARGQDTDVEMWNDSLHIVYLKQMFMVYRHLLCKCSSTFVAVWLFEHRVVACAGAWTCSCTYARALDKDGEKDGKRKRKRQRESSAQISECVWQRGQPWRQVPALQHWKWHMTALTFVIPCLPTPPNPSLQQTLRLA